MITVEMIMEEGVCYPREKVERLVGNGKTIEEILRLNISPEDRIWMACRFLDKHTLICWIGDVVERAIRRHCLKCDIAEVEEWAQAWLNGEAWAHTTQATTAADFASIKHNATSATSYITYAADHAAHAAAHATTHATTHAITHVSYAASCAAYASVRAAANATVNADDVSGKELNRQIRDLLHILETESTQC